MTRNKKNNIKSASKKEKRSTQTCNYSASPVEFYISEETASYGNNGKKPFSVYHDDPEHFLRLLKGNCVDILNQGRENSVDMIFADPPYFLSNGGITCHAGKMVSVNKGKWDKSKGVEENHKFTLEWLKACQRVLKPNARIILFKSSTGFCVGCLPNFFSSACGADISQTLRICLSLFVFFINL